MKIIRRTVFVLIAFLLVEIYIDSNMIVISNVKIKNKKIPASFNGYKILQLSDLHSKNFRNNVLIDKISEIEPDIIVMTGDMVNCNDTNYDTFFNLAKTLAKKYRIYYIMGNHEQNMPEKNRKTILDFLIANGIKVLDNEKVELERDGDKIDLYGNWCNLKYYSSKGGDVNYELTKDVMTKILGEPNEKRFNILLAHNPNYIDAYSKWGADLTLSGHIHGGMVRVPFIGGVFSPDTVLFPKYSEGLYTVNDKKLNVSRGLGRGVRGFRFFNRPELNVIVLKNEE